MSTIGNLNHSFRRRREKANTSKLSSNYSTASSGGTPNPRSPRIIASRPPRTPSPPLDKNNESRTTRLANVDEARLFWNSWIATLRSPSVLRPVLHVLIILVLFLMAANLVVWNRIGSFKFGMLIFNKTEDWEDFVAKHKEEEGTMLKGNHSELDGPQRDPMYELIHPLNVLTSLNIGPELEALQGVYANNRNIIVDLTKSIPALSVYSQNLTASLKNFRRFIWQFSEAIGDYQAFVEMILNNLQQESKNLGITLSEMQPKDTWQNRPDSEQSRKIAGVWITHYEWLRKELESIGDETLRFQDDFKDAIKQRRDLQVAFEITQPRMTKEAKKRDWKNFDFLAGYEFLRKFSYVDDLALEDGAQDGYETLLEYILLPFSTTLELADSEAKYVMEKLQRTFIQNSTTESQDDTEENGNKKNNATSVAPFEMPDLEKQIEALTATYQNYVQVIIYLTDMKRIMAQNLKGITYLPAKNIPVYEDVLSGQQDNDYMEKQPDWVKEVINEKNEERKRLRHRRYVEQEEEKRKKKSWRPWRF